MFSLGQMVAGVAHEINNPLSFIQGNVTPDKIFDPFFTTKPVGSGTGLGLSISHQIVVEKHGGQLNCVSAPGEGTKMIVKIPVRVADRECLAGTMPTEMAIAFGD